MWKVGVPSGRTHLPLSFLAPSWVKQPSASVMYGARPGLSSAWMEAPKPPPRATAATTTKLILLTRFPYLLFACSIRNSIGHLPSRHNGRTDQGAVMLGSSSRNAVNVPALQQCPGSCHPLTDKERPAQVAPRRSLVCRQPMAARRRSASHRERCTGSDRRSHQRHPDHRSGWSGRPRGRCQPSRRRPSRRRCTACPCVRR